MSVSVIFVTGMAQRRYEQGKYSVKTGTENTVYIQGLLCLQTYVLFEEWHYTQIKYFVKCLDKYLDDFT